MAKKQRFEFRTDETEQQRWTKAALDAGLSLASWVRSACEEMIKRQMALCQDKTASEKSVQPSPGITTKGTCPKCLRLGKRPNCPYCA